MTPQQESALTRANDLRTRRAELKVRMKHGHEDVRILLLDPPPLLEGMRVEDFVRACPKVGPVKTGTLLRKAKLGPTEKLGKIDLGRRCFLRSLLP